MKKTTCLLYCFVLLLCPSLRAVEVELTYEPSDSEPHMLHQLMPVFNDDDLWTEGQDQFTEKVQHFQYSIPSDTSQEESAMLLSMDRDGDGQRHLFLDLNRNQKVDSNERFALKPSPHMADFSREPDSVFYTGKIEFPKPENEKETFPIILHCLFLPGHGGEKQLIFGATNWGWYRGKVNLNGVDYRILLQDQNTNGDFHDFQVDEQGLHDGLFLKDEEFSAKAERFMGEPLRRKVMLDGQAYRIEVKDEGAKISIEPIEVACGKVHLKTPDLTVSLFHADWGYFPLQQGDENSLPAGTWKVSNFSRENAEQTKHLLFSASDKMTLEVAAEKTTELDLDTRLKAEVSQRLRRTTLQLSLSLTTSQGARFGNYWGQDAAFKGIPFVITNASGETVQEGMFEFG